MGVLCTAITVRSSIIGLVFNVSLDYSLLNHFSGSSLWNRSSHLLVRIDNSLTTHCRRCQRALSSLWNPLTVLCSLKFSAEPSKSRNEASWIIYEEVTVRVMQMIGLQKMAMDVFIPSWGEINLSLAAAVVFIFLLSCYQHFLAGDDTSKDIVEEKVLHLPAIPELEDVVLSSTTAQAVVRVRMIETHCLKTYVFTILMLQCVWVESLEHFLFDFLEIWCKIDAVLLTLDLRKFCLLY